jgi:hypothetical protein
VVKLILQRRTGGDIQVARNNNRKVVPEARAALDQMKYEVAGQVGVNLKKGYNGDLTSKEAGYIGGYMVKRMIEQAERQMAGK